MKKYDEYSQWADVLHQEDVAVEEPSAQLAPIGKLVMNDLMRYYPAYEDASEESDDRQEELACHKVEQVEECHVKHTETVPWTK